MGEKHPSPRTLGEDARVIFALLCGQHFVTNAHIFDVIWGNDPDGGPLSWDKIIHIRISQLRAYLKDYNIDILTADRCGPRGSARYFIPLNQREAARAIVFEPRHFSAAHARAYEREQLNART